MLWVHETTLDGESLKLICRYNEEANSLSLCTTHDYNIHEASWRWRVVTSNIEGERNSEMVICVLQNGEASNLILPGNVKTVCVHLEPDLCIVRALQQLLDWRPINLQIDNIPSEEWNKSNKPNNDDDSIFPNVV